jgi:hypothetical protein
MHLNLRIPFARGPRLCRRPACEHLCFDEKPEKPQRREEHREKRLPMLSLCSSRLRGLSLCGLIGLRRLCSLVSSLQLKRNLSFRWASAADLRHGSSPRTGFRCAAWFPDLSSFVQPPQYYYAARAYEPSSEIVVNGADGVTRPTCRLCS